VFICVHLWTNSLTLKIEDKFARVAALRPARSKVIGAPFTAPIKGTGDRLAELLGARINRNHYGEHLSLRQWYSTPEMCSPDPRSLALLVPASVGAQNCSEVAVDPARWLFLDTETTGLAGGTGTYAFMVGIAWWDAGGLEVEQFFLRDLNEEHSLLLELSTRVKERPVLVTFNGKSFDWPLLETRYRMTRSFSVFAPKLHIDLLHPARQIWRLRLGSVRLRDLERHVLGSDGRALDWSRHDDIDSSLIPQLYFDYLRGGPIEPIAGIFRHNQMDLRGLAALAGRVFSLLQEGSGPGEANCAERASRDPIEVLGLSRLLRKRGESGRARELYEAALGAGLPDSIERLAQREFAQLAKRAFDYERAVSLWNALRRIPHARRTATFDALPEDRRRATEAAIEAAEQLAIHYEHRAKEPRRALDLVREAMAELRDARRSGTIAREYEARACARLTRRLERLERRCTDSPLFERTRRTVSRSPRTTAVQ
jgi:uncharacterized protein YprB with RNaseH-like and TPR domain